LRSVLFCVILQSPAYTGENIELKEVSRTVALAVKIQLTNECNLRCYYCMRRRNDLLGRPTPRISEEYGNVERWLRECPDLGIKLAELTGGDPSLWSKKDADGQDGLQKILSLCKEELEIFTLLPLSAKGLCDSLTRQGGKDLLSLPGLLRISVHDEPRNRGESLKTVAKALESTVEFRPKGETQLGVILVPGANGNLQQELLKPILALAEESLAPILPIPVFDTWQNEEKVGFNELWSIIATEQQDVLDWFVRQPIVLPQGTDKVAFLLNGGNNLDSTNCKAAEAVATIDNGRLFGPCGRLKGSIIPIRESFAEALSSAEWLNCIKQSGTLDGCDRCIFNCGNVMGTLSRDTSPAEQLEAFCTM